MSLEFCEPQRLLQNCVGYQLGRASKSNSNNDGLQSESIYMCIIKKKRRSLKMKFSIFFYNVDKNRLFMGKCG